MEKIELHFSWSSVATLGLIFWGLSTVFCSTPVRVTELPDNLNTAQVLKVEARGRPSNYHFAVTIDSPDIGCEQYANWWEVISEDGELLYRRILAHSHVDEQPFTRNGGSIPLQPNQIAIVRVHMHPTGYSTKAQIGTVEAGFYPITLDPDFAMQVAQQQPLPTGCAY